jgi:hypothetical protein
VNSEMNYRPDFRGIIKAEFRPSLRSVPEILQAEPCSLHDQV